MKRELAFLTAHTIKEIQKLEIVLPDIYKDIFYTKAKEENIKINDIDKEEALLYALNKIKQTEHQAHESTVFLRKSINSAQEAIKNKDENRLQEITNSLTILENKIKKLQSQIFFDDLTALYNRRWLYENYLTEEKFQTDGILVFLDIDEFKYINDIHGHLIGDKVLKLLAQSLKKLKDTHAVRYAGDEFLLISKTVSKTKMNNMLINLLKRLQSTGLKSQTSIFHVTFSYGVTEFEQGDDLNTAIQRADANMYDYKNSK